MSLALLLTLTSNIIGIFTVPFILPHVAAAAGLGNQAAIGAAAAQAAGGAAAAAAGGGAAAVAAGGGAAAVAGGTMLEPLPLMLQLCQTILLPTFLGAALRGMVPGRSQLNLIDHMELQNIPFMYLTHPLAMNPLHDFC